jgi:hypothetical protein
MKRSALLLGSVAAVMLLASLADAGQPLVEVCHKGKQTIRIAAPAVPAHVGHGDTACACAVIDDCATQDGKLDAATCECEVEPPGCPLDVVVDCAERGGQLDTETCECEVDAFACEPAGICDDTGYNFGCNGNEYCACGTDSAGNGVCMQTLDVDCLDVPACPNGQSDCPDGTVCVVASCCTNLEPPDICAPLCPPLP